ncbi:MAG: MarR family winged helix-turn-helix transcriptional regulator [Thermomicrobiales bacterium]
MSEERRSVVRAVGQIFQRMIWVHQHDIASRLSDRGLTALQFSALGILDREGPALPIGEIGEGMSTPASSMTSAIDRLVDLGLVERAPHPSDRRAVLVRITSEGVALVREVEEQRLETMLSVLDSISDDDLATFLTRLRQIADEALGARR